MSTFPWLTATVFLPLAGAVLTLPIAALGRLRPGDPFRQERARLPLADRLARWWALLVSIATFGVSVGILASATRCTSRSVWRRYATSWATVTKVRPCRLAISCSWLRRAIHSRV